MMKTPQGQSVDALPRPFKLTSSSSSHVSHEFFSIQPHGRLKPLPFSANYFLW
jgi:hypothetical protein